ERVARAVERHGDRFLRRVFTPGELAYCASSEAHRAARLAARFAAKEAVLKALGIGLRESRWTGAGVCRDERGRPSVRLTGRLAEIAAARGATRIHLSLSHTQEYAVAQVVIEG